MKTSQSIVEFAKAMTKFQQNVPKIEKTAEGKIAGKSKSGQSYDYSYKYADLAVIWDKIRGTLTDNGLSVIQAPAHYAEPSLTTMILHESGEWVEGTMKLAISRDDPQGHGSAITYARRYALCAMLGIVADSDNDAQEHKYITSIGKQKVVNAVKAIYPELERPDEIVNCIQIIIGKHPSRILNDETDEVIETIKAYTAKKIEE